MNTQLSRRRLLAGTGGLAILIGSAPLLNACGSDSAGKTTLDAWGNHPEWKETLDEIMDAFRASHPDIDVNWAFRPNANYQAAVNTAIAGGQPPDIFGWLEGVSIRDGAAAGSIVDLTGKVDTSVMIDAARAQVEFDGKTWGCPLAAYTVGIFYQRKVFADLNLTPPKTWDQLVDVTKRLDAAGQTPWAVPSKDMILPYFFYVLAVSSVLGSAGFEALLAGARKLTDPDLVAGAQLMADLAPYFNEGFLAQGYAEGKAAFAQGRAAMIIGGSADFAGYKEANPSVDVGVFGFPSPDGSMTVTTSGMDLNYTVSATSDNKDAAATFIGWLPSAECQQIVVDKLAIPIRKGVTPSSDTDTARIARETIAAGQPDIPLLLDTPQGGGTLAALADLSGIFSGTVSAMDFATAMQKSLTIS